MDVIPAVIHQHLLNIWKLACGVIKLKLTHRKQVASKFHLFLGVFGADIVGLSLTVDLYCETDWKLCHI